MAIGFQNVPHTYRVESPEGARWITVAVRGDFARFVRASSRPAGAGALPPPGGPRTQAVMQALGSWLIAVTMAGALIFGCANHFVFASPGHVSHVNPQWRQLFATTAVLLAVTEALRSGPAIPFSSEGNLS